MPYITVTSYISNRESNKEKAIEAAVTNALASYPGYNVSDVSVALKPDGSYVEVITLSI